MQKTIGPWKKNYARPKIFLVLNDILRLPSKIFPGNIAKFTTLMAQASCCRFAIFLNHLTLGGEFRRTESGRDRNRDDTFCLSVPDPSNFGSLKCSTQFQVVHEIAMFVVVQLFLDICKSSMSKKVAYLSTSLRANKRIPMS